MGYWVIKASGGGTTRTGHKKFKSKQAADNYSKKTRKSIPFYAKPFIKTESVYKGK